MFNLQVFTIACKKYIKRLPLIYRGFLAIKKMRIFARPCIVGVNNTVVNKGTFTKVVMDVVGDNNSIKIGENTNVKNLFIYIRGDHHRIYIGSNCYIGGGELWLEDHHGLIDVHESTTIENAHLAVTEPYSRLEIGRDCMLAKHVEIRTGDSHSIVDANTGERINRAANVTLQRHVWVGAHAKILKGVTIGHNSVIGTASLVTNNIPPNSIAAGIPAKVLRSNIDWLRERI
jgi:acetyltransferase-like isoleucine patch superfamily enzyme